MRILIQRVSEASVTIDQKINGAISKGLLILLGIEPADTQEDADWLVRKTSSLRIFDDENGVMNLSGMDINAEYLVISQFTLHASTKKGNRPSYMKAARPEHAIPLYEYFIKQLNIVSTTKIQTGIFAAEMEVNLTNNGPVTIWIDSKNRE